MPYEFLPPLVFRRRLSRAVLLPPVLLGTLALVFLGQIAYLLSTAARVEHTDQVIARANALLTLFVDGETGVRGFLLTGDPRFLAPYHAAEARTGPAFDELAALVADNPPQGERLAALRADHAAWQGYARRRLAPGEGASPVLAAEGKQRMDAMRVQIAGFIRVEEELREERTRTARRATWAVAGTSLALALLLGGALANSTRHQLVGVAGSYQKALVAAEERAESLRRSAHRLATLHDIDRAILAAEALPDLVGAALREVAAVVPGDAFVATPNTAGGPARVLGRAGAGAPAVEVPALPPEADPSGYTPDLTAVASPSPLHDRLARSGYRSCVIVPLDTGGRRFGVLVLADARPDAFTEEHRQVAREVGRQLAIAFEQAELREQLRRYAADLERRVAERTRELQESLGRVKQLQGLLPICAWCKKVRDDSNYWHQVDHYVAAHTDARFSHGMCPDCERQHMADLPADGEDRPLGE